MKELLASAREGATPGIWSGSVELARRSEVFIDKKTDSEITLRLSEKGKCISHVINLWPKDGDWISDCRCKGDPCEHILAAMINLSQDLKTNKTKSKVSTIAGRVGYRFSRNKGALCFERVVVNGRKSTSITTTLSALTAGRILGPSVAPTRHDIAVESVLGSERRGVLSSGLMHRLIKKLAHIADIKIDGKKIKVSPNSTGFIVCVEDYGGGVRLYGKQDPSITEVFRNGVALCGNTLKPISHSKLSPEELRMLAEGKVFGAKEVVELVSEILPVLSKKFTIEIRSKKLPGSLILKPRLLFLSKSHGDQLEVTSRISYGDPEVAYIQDGRLILLGKEVPLRDHKEEKKLQSMLYNRFQLNLCETKILSGEEAVYFTESLQESEAFLTGDGFPQFHYKGTLSPDIKISVSKNQQPVFRIDFQTSEEAGEKTQSEAVIIDPNLVFKAWETGQSLVPLSDSGWARIPQSWLDQHGHKVLDLLNSRDDKEQLPKAMVPDLEKMCRDFKSVKEEDIQELRKISFDFNDKETKILDRELAAKLRDYQKQGVDWLHFFQKRSLGALLADDMGLGKTLQTICVLDGLSLIVAPTSVLYNWEKEIKRFRPELKIHIYHGANRQLDTKYDVILTSYSIVRLDFQELKKHLWDNIVLDEAQTIKNPDSQVAQAIFQLQSKFKLALSGTPIENQLEDIWSLFAFLHPGLLSNRKDFQKRYVRPISAGQNEILHRLQQRLQPFILRRMKSQVAKELPMRTNVQLYAELSEEERQLYRAIKAATHKEVLSNLNHKGSIMLALEALLRLRQAACHSSLIPNQSFETSSKLELLVETLNRSLASGHKALVFSQWTSFLDIIGNRLEKEGLKHLRIDGSTRNRGKIVDEFQTQKKASILLLSLKAAGVGLNLTEADHVFIVDPWWNPAIEEQAADRAHRIGQTKPVIIHRLVAKNTVEEKILQLQEKKKELASMVIGVQKTAKAITKEDILKLLE